MGGRHRKKAAITLIEAINFNMECQSRPSRLAATNLTFQLLVSHATELSPHQANLRVIHSQMNMRRYRYLDLLAIDFVVVLPISSLVGPKTCSSAWSFLLTLIKVAVEVVAAPITYAPSAGLRRLRRQTLSGRRHL